MSNVLPALALAFAAFLIGMQVLVRLRARAQRGKPVPALPGDLGEQVRRLPRSLLYFFSPSCGACRTITPRVRALREGNKAVFLVDGSADLDVARALGVMSTPSIVEIEGGRIAGFHLGGMPAEVAARFA